MSVDGRMDKENVMYTYSIMLSSLNKEGNSAIYNNVDGIGRRRQWHPTPVLLPGKSHGQRNLVGDSPWGRKESDTTEQLHFIFI